MWGAVNFDNHAALEVFRRNHGALTSLDSIFVRSINRDPIPLTPTMLPAVTPRGNGDWH
jgi:hypothetical protein